MSYDSRQNGAANYNSWMHIPSGDYAAIEQGANNENLKQRNYAQLVYQVNPTPINISGDVIVDSVGLDDSGTVKVSGDQLKVFDQSTVDELRELNNQITELQSTVTTLTSQIVNTDYSRIIQEYGEDTYIAHAPVGTTIDTSGWRVQKIDEFGSKSWAGGGDFNQPANVPLSALTYSY